jgi:hypothetical protein
MIAFQDIRAEMREAMPAITMPYGGQTAPPAQVRRGRKGPARDDLDTPVERWMEAAFEGLIRCHETGEPYALVPCFMNGEPAAVIAIAQQIGSKVHIMPLFLACQPWMNFSGPPSEDGEEDGGGPARSEEDAPAPS